MAVPAEDEPRHGDQGDGYVCGDESPGPRPPSLPRAAREYPSSVSLFAVVMLVAAVVLVGAVQFPGLVARVGTDARRSRRRSARKAKLRVVESRHDEEFVRAVERDLAALPTIDEHDR